MNLYKYSHLFGSETAVKTFSVPHVNLTQKKENTVLEKRNIVLEKLLYYYKQEI